jgi:immune inhibitor A
MVGVLVNDFVEDKVTIMRRSVVTLVALLAVCLCLALAGIGALLISRPSGALQPAALGASPMAGDSTVAAPLPGTPLPSVPETTADGLLHAQIPERNLYEIVPRLRKDLALLTPAPTPAAHTHQVGDKDTFFVLEDAAAGKFRSVSATLQAITPHSYFWVEDGISFDQAALQNAADFFEQHVYPTDHRYFGSEQSPGIDGDVHINVLNTRFRQAAGYFSAEDTYPRTLVPYSNQRNIIYMNIEALQVANDEYNADLGHEFQHLIHNFEAQHKTGWIDEGMGDLAIKVNGFPVGGVLGLYARDPNTQLNTWSNVPRLTLPHYAASYLFFDFTAGRFGPDFTRAVIHAPEEGINGIQAVLDQYQEGMRFDDLFADWAVANYLNDPTIENGRYAYTNESTFHISGEPVFSQYPVNQTARMHEYASNYYSLQPDGGDVTLYFTGTTTAKLLPVDAHSGRWIWYSNRADLADTTLTRQVDLSNVSKATLQFWEWYNVEYNFDYAYVEASTDGGQTWDILPGKYTTTDNPNGASYGPAYTGRSGVTDQKSGQPAQWVQEQIDLTPYAGKAILLRFEYITDDAYNAPGWAIDDISIPEINFFDGGENGANGWQSSGFVRSDNVLPQHYAVQVVESGTPTQVVRLPLDDQNRGMLTIKGFGKSVSQAELIVTAEAPTTTEETDYQFSIVPQ